MAEQDDNWLGSTARQYPHLAEFLALAGGGLFQCDHEGHFIRVNDRLCQMLGHSEKNLVGRHISITYPPEHQHQLMQRIQHVRQHGFAIWERECLRGDGSRFPAEVHVLLLPDGSVLGLLRDLSELRQLQQAKDERSRWELLARSTLNSLPAHICVLDENGTIVAVNQAWRDFAAHNDGRPERVGEGVNYLEVCERAARDDPSAAPMLQGLRRVLTGDARFSIDYPCDSPTEVRWFNMLAVRFRENDGVRVVVVHTDISLSKHTELSLRDSETRYRSLLETAQEGVWLLDAHGRTTFTNRFLERLLGYSGDEMRGHGMVEFMDADAREQAEAVLTSGTQGLEGEYEFCFRRRDDSIVWTQMHCNPLTAAGGGWQGVLCMVTDITQRHYSEAALRASEERFLTAFEYAASGMALVGLDGSWLRINNALCDTLGYTRQELFALKPADLVYADDRNADRHLRRQLLAGDIPYYRVEQRYLHKNGQPRWLLLAISLVRGRHGEPLHYIVQSQDITARVLSESASTRHARLQEMLASFNQQALTLHRIEEVYVQAVHIAAQALGAQHAWLLELDESQQFWTLMASTGWTQVSNGSRLQLEPAPVGAEPLHYYAPVFEAEGIVSGLDATIEGMSRPWGLIGVYARQACPFDPQDRTFLHSLALTVAAAIERRQAQEARIEYLRLEHRRNQEHFRLAAMLERSRDEIVMIVDLQQRVEFVNTAFVRLTGWHEADIVGQPMAVAYSEGQTRCDQIWQELQNKNGWRGRLEMRGPDDRRLVLEGSVSPVRDDAGKITGYVTVATDITYQNQLENRLLREEKLKSLGYMAAGIAHDFNNILNVILGNSELASLDLPAGSPGTENLQQIVIAVERGRTLVDQMLTFARQEQPRYSTVSLSTLAQETGKLMRPGLPSNITLRVDTDERAPVILADPVQLRQIILNLATNAVHALRPDGGTLTIRVTQADTAPDEQPQVKLEVMDTGCGIAPELLDRIFDPFFSTRDVGEGTGLGLSVVHGIVERHGGQVRVSSTVGQGSCFTVLLPVQPPVPDDSAGS